MSNASTFELMARLVLSLGVVLGLMWFMARVMKKRGLTPVARRGSTLRGIDVELLARKSLGRNTSIAVVRTGDRAMVIGITEHQITKLDDADVEEIALEEDVDIDGQRTADAKGLPSSGQAWKMMLDHVRERTVRR